MITLKTKHILKSLGFALAATPGVTFAGLLVITLIEGLGYAVTKIQFVGHWWIILIVVYILSLIYILYEPKIKVNRERKKVVDALILYMKDQQDRRNKPQPSEYELELIKEYLLERVKVFVWFNSEIWSIDFPNEKYPEYLFDIVENFMKYWENQKSKYGA